MLSRTCTGAWSATVTAAIWGSKNARESCSTAVVLVRNGVHSWPKFHLMHDKMGKDVNSDSSLGTMILFCKKRSNQTIKPPSTCCKLSLDVDDASLSPTCHHKYTVAHKVKSSIVLWDEAAGLTQFCHPIFVNHGRFEPDTPAQTVAERAARKI